MNFQHIFDFKGAKKIHSSGLTRCTSALQAWAFYGIIGGYFSIKRAINTSQIFLSIFLNFKSPLPQKAVSFFAGQNHGRFYQSRLLLFYGYTLHNPFHINHSLFPLYR